MTKPSDRSQESPVITPHDPQVEDGFAAYMTTGWAEATPRTVNPNPVGRYVARRRSALASEVPSLTIVIPAGRAVARTGDQLFRYRATAEFLYYVGEPVAGATLVISRSGATLYAPEPARRGTAAAWSSRAGALWEGEQPTLAERAARLNLPVRPLAELERALTRSRWVALLGPGLDPSTLPTAGRRERELEGLVAALAAEARLVKDAYELGELSLAVRDSERAFTDLARELRPGVTERWLEGTFMRTARTLGEECGYAAIVAAGPHACTLHWSQNTGMVNKGDLVLVDAGVELASGYTADLTRVFPADGTFTAAQREVTETVAAAQAAGIAALRPDAPFGAAHAAAMFVLCEALCRWGIVSESPEALYESGRYRRFTLHGTSHMLGLDVHDCASARADLAKGPLQEGMVLTVEPGLYFQPDDLLAPPELRGLGVRIEDDLVVTGNGAANLTAGLPRRPDEVEAWLRSIR